MLKTFRETITSLKDKSYGNTIVSKRMWPVIWYWTQYLLVFTVVPWLVFVGIMTYFLPQLPRALKDSLPNARISLQNGQFSTDLNQPYVLGDKSFSLIIDTHASNSSVLKNYESGVLVASTEAFLKSLDGSSDSAKFPANLNFSTNKNQVLAWITSHQGNLWLAGFLIITLFAILAGIFYWLYNLAAFAVGGLLFWILARMQHRQLDYRGAVKMAIYAAILPFLVSALFSVSSNPLMLIVNFIIFFYLGYNWIQNLPEEIHPETKQNP